MILYATGYFLITTSKYFYSYLSQNIDNMNKNIKVVIFQAPFPICLKEVLKIYATYVQRNDLACSCNHCCSGNATMYFAFFPTPYHKQHGFWKTFIEDTMCILIFSTTFDYISCSKKNQSDTIINVHRSAYKVPVIPVGF